MRCSFCQHPIEAGHAWKGGEERFYCSEFCADSENYDDTDTVVQSAVALSPPRKEQIDRAYLTRLERLLPLLQTARRDALPSLTGSR